jgi:hypothetical protein
MSEFGAMQLNSDMGLEGRGNVHHITGILNASIITNITVSSLL